MMGSIEGDYEFTMGPFLNAGIPDFPGITFATGTSVIMTAEGSLNLVEAFAIDGAEQACSNVAILMTISGGTGIWQGASGHLISSGSFHTGSWSGEYDYQGEVCGGSISSEEGSWGRLKAKFRD